jgi:hypothetical protein
MSDKFVLKKWSQRILGIQPDLKVEYDTVDTQVVDTTLQIYPVFAITSVLKMTVSTVIFIASVYSKNGTITGMFEGIDEIFARDENGDFTEAGWMDMLVVLHILSGICIFYCARLSVRVKLQYIGFAVPLILTIPLATLIQLSIEVEDFGFWYPTVPDHETTILILIALGFGFISMITLTEHIWHDRSKTYALDR